MAAEAARLAEAVDLLPVGALPPGALEALAMRLSRRVELACHVLPAGELPLRRIPNRDQLDANALLEAVEARATRDTRLLVGVTSEDIATPVFTFVFGLARQGGRASVVSLARTDPSFYGLPPDPARRDERAVAEILHEMGHLATLEHCPDRGCLMSFAGNVERVDTRGSRFCAACAERLPHWLRGPAPLPEIVCGSTPRGAPSGSGAAASAVVRHVERLPSQHDVQAGQHVLELPLGLADHLSVRSRIRRAAAAIPGSGRVSRTPATRFMAWVTRRAR